MTGPQVITPQPCSTCACRLTWLTDDGRLICDRCGVDRGMLSTQVQNFIRTIEQHFGPLAEPVVLRGKDSTQAKADRHLINLEKAEDV
jgi:Zinc-finger of RNA-polymerase I-specific TFIIB, Rrn7